MQRGGTRERERLPQREDRGEPGGDQSRRSTSYRTTKIWTDAGVRTRGQHLEQENFLETNREDRG
eukprot:8743180-Heterocapsa_arctica.AAC.1